LLQVSWVTTVAVVPATLIWPIAQRTRMVRWGALRRWRSAIWAKLNAVCGMMLKPIDMRQKPLSTQHSALV
jgi:hypothetical protein